MMAREYLEKGRNLAERIPYSVIALASRLAVADVFWRSGQTKVSGFSIREETFYLFREEYKVPLLPSDVAATSVLSPSMFSRSFCFSAWHLGFPRSDSSG